jgi:tetratricopeptide (TPR) repeat protein
MKVRQQTASLMPRHRACRTSPSALALLGAVVLCVSSSATVAANPSASPFRAARQDKEKEKDTVRLKDGKSDSGKIESENYVGVSLGGSKMVAWDKVQSIEYAGGTDYTAALQSLTAGKLEEALSEFEAIRAAPKVRPVLRQNAMFNIAQILQRQAKTDEAVSAYRELFDAFPEGRYLRAAGDGLVACLMSKKDPAGASAALDKIGDGAKGLDAFKPEIAVMRARLFEFSKKPAEAKAAYESAANAPGAVGQEAQLGLARCLALDGKGSDAEQACRKLVTADAPNYVLAGAWNGIGDVWSEQGRAKKDSEMLLDALTAYLRGVVQYAPLPGEPSIEYERALAGSARCFKFIAQLDTQKERKNRYEQFSQQRIELLKRDYPSSLFLE